MHVSFTSRWAVEEGADYIIAETFGMQAEALLALEAIKAHDIPAVVTMTPNLDDDTTIDPGEKIPVAQALRTLEEHGADVVGVNCWRGPATMLPLMEKVRRACKGHVAALPVPYRTTPQRQSFFVLKDLATESQLSFPCNLDEHLATRRAMADFAVKANEMDIKYLGICCGNSPGHMRSLAEALGRRPEASKYSADMSKHFMLGSDSSLKEANTKTLHQKLYGAAEPEEE